MAYLYSLSMNRKAFKQKVPLDNLNDDELYGSTRFFRSAVQDLCVIYSSLYAKYGRQLNGKNIEKIQHASRQS